MRVVTQNLWGIRGDWEARRAVLIDGFRELEPDIVAFIEAIKTDEYDQVVDLLGPEYQVAHQTERELQAHAAARFLEELVGARNAHVVLAGDFTSDPEAANVRFIAGRQSLDGTSVCYRDAWESVHPGEPGETFTPDNPLVADWDWPFRRLDYVFVRCGLHGGPTLEITACERIFDHPVDGVWASDHFGVYADLEIPSPG
jgi:endonuclease/exonuclease/phosphatase family metal-dependent hydrolase